MIHYKKLCHTGAGRYPDDSSIFATATHKRVLSASQRAFDWLDTGLRRYDGL